MWLNVFLFFLVVKYSSYDAYEFDFLILHFLWLKLLIFVIDFYNLYGITTACRKNVLTAFDPYSPYKNSYDFIVIPSFLESVKTPASSDFDFFFFISAEDYSF